MAPADTGSTVWILSTRNRCLDWEVMAPFATLVGAMRAAREWLDDHGQGERDRMWLGDADATEWRLFLPGGDREFTARRHVVLR